ncbi:hypothetical protein LIER_27446 [Lithospermum erythrorhizon]|uniref:Uncharacterized protein n=1 Tax=Lithospermum erythrorhizon TaxID=34254 RepID=A0AAV3RE32_LITER
MPFPLMSEPDRKVWKVSSSGKFEVRSAYKLVCKLERDQSGRPSSSRGAVGGQCFHLWHPNPSRTRLCIVQLHSSSLMSMSVPFSSV